MLDTARKSAVAATGLSCVVVACMAVRVGRVDRLLAVGRLVLRKRIEALEDLQKPRMIWAIIIA
jgi:hypothetical protein